MEDLIAQDIAPRSTKPLGRKGYGSTPHLVGSRVGPSDSHAEPSLCAIFTRKIRNRHDRIIVTEKLDGANMLAAKHDGNIIAISRAGYLAADTKWPMQKMFGRYVDDRRRVYASLLLEGERLGGEWLLQAHGTRYEILDPRDLFVGFSIIGPRGRIPHDEFTRRMGDHGLPTAHVISDGPALSQEDAVSLLGDNGFHRSIDPVEGAVWVLETRGEFNAIAKHVIPTKIDGKYLPLVSNGPNLWNYTGEDYAVE